MSGVHVIIIIIIIITYIARAQCTRAHLYLQRVGRG